MFTHSTSDYSKRYMCVNCNFKCSKKGDWSRHILTAKHKMFTNVDDKTSPPNNVYYCDCGNEYKYRQSLYVHKKSCKYLEDKKTTNDIQYGEAKTSIVEPTSETNIVLSLLKQNEEFKQLIAQQYSVMAEQYNVMTERHHENVALQLKNQELNQKLIAVMKDSNGTVINNNTINNNKQFNLNIFLNTTCKDAMNMNEFIKTINVKVSDLDYIGKEGYIEGISRVIIQGLNELEITRRPIHCTDIKRKSLYLKDNDTWNKESSNMGNMKKMINSVQNKNVRTIPAWQEANPSSKTCLSPKNMEYVTIVNKVMGGSTDDEDEQNYRGIINKVTNAVLIDKHELSAIGELEISVMQDQRDESDAVMQNANE